MKLKNPTLYTVDFKLAKLLKEKQFDILTEFCYEKHGQMLMGSTSGYYAANEENIYLAPTFEQLHWWLMEKGIYVGISFSRAYQNGKFFPVVETQTIQEGNLSSEPHKYSYILYMLKHYENILNKAYFEAVQLINLNQS